MTRVFRHGASCLALLLALLGAATAGCGESRPPKPPDSEKAKVESTLRQSYGRYLDRLDTRLIWLPHVGGVTPVGGGELPGAWAYRASYSLKSIPLQFSYTALANDPFYDPRYLIHDDIGGAKRFWLLADKYHRDFPTQPTFNYWRTSTDGVSKEEPYRSLLKGHPGVSVVVYEFDDYWGGERAPMLGVYWWNSRRAEWVLLHRGSLPDLR